MQSDGKIIVSGQAETPPGSSPFDSRDIDIYVSRFNTNGTLDTTFGDTVNTPGTRASTSPTATPPGTTVVTDQAYGLNIVADDAIVITGGRGTDTARPTKLDRDFGAIKLTPGGALDTTLRQHRPQQRRRRDRRRGAGERDGRRWPQLQREPAPGGRARRRPDRSSAATRACPRRLRTRRGPNRPILARFTATGALDPTFGGGDGVASAEVFGPAPAFAEAYDVGVQSTGKYVAAGYGSRTGVGPVDVVTYRFNADGTHDPSFGTSGGTTYDRAGVEDRGRDLVVLPDDRVLIAGSTGTHLVSALPQLNALLYMLRADGTPDASFGDAGAISVHLGGPSDAFFGSTVMPGGKKVVAAGYRGAASNADDQAALVRVDLSAAGSGPRWPGRSRRPDGTGRPDRTRRTRRTRRPGRHARRHRPARSHGPARRRPRTSA